MSISSNYQKLEKLTEDFNRKSPFSQLKSLEESSSILEK